MKTVTISVRVSEQDAEFIAGLDIANASTPSDKLRAIIAEAREQRQQPRSFAQALHQMEHLLQRSRNHVRDLEHRHRVHSELVGLIHEWLPEMAAMLMTFVDDQAAPASGDRSAKQPQQEQLAELERRVADRLFALMESTLRLGVTRQCRCYDAEVVAKRLGPVLELAQLINAAAPSKESSS